MKTGGKGKNIAGTLKSFKENIIQDLNHSSSMLSSEKNEESWERNMQLWQERVLEPQLANLSQSLERKIGQISKSSTPKSNVGDIMSELHRKLAEKANKLERLEIEHSKRLSGNKSGSPTYSDTSSEFIRFKTPVTRFN
jgi:hypothetical protein